MEILVSAGMIIFAIAFFYVYFLASAILFCDAPVSLIGALFSFFCLCPIGRHKIHIGREMKYRWADCISEVNPLYVAGFFRKSASDKNILSNLKGKFYCETALCGIWAIAFICKICTIYMNANIWKICDYVFGGCFAVAEVVWCYYALYYKWYYNEAFRYTEGPDHIWKPFSNIAEYSRNPQFASSYYFYYRVPFEEIKNKIEQECTSQQYIFAGAYSKKEVHSIIYWKKTEKSVEILQLGQMQKYSEENMQILNEFFAHFWKQELSAEKQKVKVIAILCIENANRELRRHLLSLCYVDQKDGEQGRYRLPVVILHQEEPQVQILPLYSKRRGKKEYDEMKEEVSSILGLSTTREEE